MVVRFPLLVVFSFLQSGASSFGGFGIVDHQLVLAQTDALSNGAQTIIATNFPNALDAYKNILVEYPLPTKMVTGATLAVCGDAIAQSRTDDDYDKRRAGSFAAFDAVYRAVQHASFPAIVQQCHGQYFGAVVASFPLLKVLVENLGWENPSYYFGAMEQTLASQLGIVPFFYYPVFYTVTAIVQGLDFDGALERVQETFIPLMKRNLLFWIPVQFIQFGYLDESIQIPFLSICGLCWTFIISVIAGNAKQNIEDEMKQCVIESIDDYEVEECLVQAVEEEEILQKELLRI